MCVAIVSSVYQMWESTESDRPEGLVDRNPKEMSEEQRRTNARVSRGVAGYDATMWRPFDLVFADQGGGAIGDWNFFDHRKTFGVLSKRAVKVLRPCLQGRYETLEVFLEGEQYYCLRCHKYLDCLDADASDVVYFSGGNDVMRIRRFCFHKERLPLSAIFSIPELPTTLFATDGVPECVANSGLGGFYFELVDGERPSTTERYTYHNEHLQVQVDIPATWYVTTWRKGNIHDPDCGGPDFQVSDDDMPPVCGRRHLFSALLYRPLGTVDLDASIILSIWRGPDLGEVLLNNLRSQRSEIHDSGVWHCGSEVFQYFDTRASRFFYSQADGDFWYSGVISAEETRFFEEAVAVMESMRR